MAKAHDDLLWRRFAAALLRALALIWVGVAIGVGLAAGAAFNASSAELAVAADVNRHSFAALNRTETVLAPLALALAAAAAGPVWSRALCALPAFAVAVQGVWLLPLMDARVDLLLAGETPPPSSLHAAYVAVEALKLLALLAVTVAGSAAWRR